MDTIQQGLIALIKSAVTQAPQPLPAGFDLEAAYPVICSHQIYTLAFEGAVLSGISTDLSIMKKLFQIYCKALVVTEGQLRQMGRVLDAFREAGIHYMPLKGYNMRPRYPKPELRMMGDTDILIRMDQYDQVAAIMEGFGFVFKEEADHCMVWMRPGNTVEIHRRVVPKTDRDFYTYFGSGWKFSSGQLEYCHGMSPEDEFVYMFAHFTKHYRDGGIGCRHVTDLWVFRQICPDLDEAQVKRKLQKLGLAEFYNNCCRLMDVWFEDGISDSVTEYMTQYLFYSGAYGTAETHRMSEALRNAGGVPTGFRGKLGFIWNLAFPKLSIMKAEYPLLQKIPVLLPVFWLWRLFDKMIIQKKSLHDHQQMLSQLSTDNLASRETALRYVGLKR